MNIETVIALIVAVSGTSGLVSAITTGVFKFLEYRKAKRGDTWEAKLDTKLAPLIQDREEAKKERMQLGEELREIRLDTTRTQLIMLMEHQPSNYDTILKIAERYFIELRGDWYCTSLFKDWARAQGISVPEHIEKATANHS